MTDSEPMLRIRDVARLLNVTAKTVRRYIASGQLAATRLGAGHWRVPESALRAFTNGGRHASTEDRPPHR